MAVSVTPNDNTCAVFGSIAGADPGTLLRFVVGGDQVPQVLSSGEIEQHLGDPFATLLLLKGNFPTTGDEVLAGLDAVVQPDDVVGSASQRSFVLGEGSQLPVGPGDVEATNRGIRFLVARGSAPHGPELIISASHPQQGLVELMAWDSRIGGFNYYRNVGDSGEWAFAGNSRDALAPPTQGKGPFESHPSGNLLMKELKLPWVHWHSFKANIFEGVFPEGDIRRTHPWFIERQGAEICELSVVMPSIVRWTSARFDHVIAADGNVAQPGRVVEQAVMSPTVNLTSSTRESAAVDGGTLDLPPTFFVDVDGLELVGLPGPPQFEVAGGVYRSSLESFGFALKDDDGFERPGDTHFAFVVPERAFEDVETLRQALDRGLVTKRLVASLLMVDFPNPVFSERRATLLRYAPLSAAIIDGASAFSDEMAQTVLDTAPSTANGSAEREFAALWAAGDDWPTTFGSALSSYYAAVVARLATQDGFNEFTRLAQSRRNRVEAMPIFESRLLLPVTNLPDEELAMGLDATVGLLDR